MESGLPPDIIWTGECLGHGTGALDQEENSVEEKPLPATLDAETFTPESWVTLAWTWEKRKDATLECSRKRVKRPQRITGKSTFTETDSSNLLTFAESLGLELGAIFVLWFRRDIRTPDDVAEKVRTRRD